MGTGELSGKSDEILEMGESSYDGLTCRPGGSNTSSDFMLCIPGYFGIANVFSRYARLIVVFISQRKNGFLNKNYNTILENDWLSAARFEHL